VSFAIPAAPMPAPASRSASAPYGTAKQEYRPALQDPGLVEALLKLRSSQGPRRSSRVISSHEPAPRATDAGFSFAQVAQVQAEPKLSADFRRPPTATQSVLRGPGRP
jgi:hypothetical protein